MTDQKLTVGNLVDLLFKTIKKENGRKYSSPEVALNVGMTDSTLKAIRYGMIGNPGIHTLIPIARFFKVPLDYFDAETEEQALAFISQSRGTLPQVERWAFRIGHLPESAQQDVLRVVEWIERAEALRLQGGDLGDLQDDDAVLSAPKN